MTQNELKRPFSILSVDWEGNFSTFDPELLSVASDRYGSFNLGNIKDLSLVETCHKSCEYFGLCGGGNGSNKFWEHGTQIPTQVLLERFEEGPPLTPLTPNPSGSYCDPSLLCPFQPMGGF